MIVSGLVIPYYVCVCVQLDERHSWVVAECVVVASTLKLANFQNCLTYLVDNSYFVWRLRYGRNTLSVRVFGMLASIVKVLELATIYMAAFCDVTHIKSLLIF